MRRVSVVIFSIVVMFLLGSAVVLADANTFRVKVPEVIEPNSNFTVPVYLSNVESVGGFSLPLGFNDDVRCVSVTWSKRFRESDAAMYAGKGEDVTYLHEDAVVVWAVWFNKGLPTDKGEGPICTLHFIANEKFRGDVGLDITDKLTPAKAELCNGEARAMPFVFKKVEGEDEDDAEAAVPNEFTLSQNYPNPFNATTVMRFSLKRDSEVNFAIYNVLGQNVATLIGGKRMSAGTYEVSWNGRADDGNEVASGVYFYKIDAGEFNEVKKMVLMK